ncbi:ABC transporter ATP-binding protein [Sinorhizobium sp. NFACC03]|uniref:ABC transporter ATP-binding protein n=1 Tax=Sinorhizobium sp. NFACC03 TaxID=1566295 RepID=UPI00088F31B6|nr:ABC transporter ATP-binding protein [Sinorhizobium sp. NFACC03]SDA61929.1 ABC-2 type transport system ATP-binding protein [Sinorhizobium sp. NFACC03]
MATHALVVDGLSKSFGAKQAVRQASFAVASGEITGFLGPNGAGKTTVMGMIMGLVEPDAGEIEFFGTRDRRRLSGMRTRVGYLQEKPRIYPDMTAKAYLRFFADLYGVPQAAARVRETLDRVGLKQAADRRLGVFSRGMQQRACLARVMLHRPEFLLLDEPTLGLDPNGVADMRAVFREMKADGVTLLFSSHQLAEMERVCDSVVFMREGTVIADGRPCDIAAAGWLQGGLRIEVFEPAAEALGVIASVDDIAGARQVGPQHVHIVLKAPLGDMRTARARAAVLLSTAGLTILSVDADTPTLEDVFLGLTRPESSAGLRPANALN